MRSSRRSIRSGYARPAREGQRPASDLKPVRRWVLWGPVGKQRVAQLAYSEFQSAMLDEGKRRRKAAKIIAVLEHFRGPLGGLTVADIGCSAGFIADELAEAG